MSRNGSEVRKLINLISQRVPRSRRKIRCLIPELVATPPPSPTRAVDVDSVLGVHKWLEQRNYTITATRAPCPDKKLCYNLSRAPLRSRIRSAALYSFRQLHFARFRRRSARLVNPQIRLTICDARKSINSPRDTSNKRTLPITNQASTWQSSVTISISSRSKGTQSTVLFRSLPLIAFHSLFVLLIVRPRLRSLTARAHTNTTARRLPSSASGIRRALLEIDLDVGRVFLLRVFLCLFASVAR